MRTWNAVINYLASDDPTMKQLSSSARKNLMQSGTPPSIVTPPLPPSIPASKHPLVPSTPLPPALTGPVSPAWDPSSRTPIPGSSGNLILVEFEYRSPHFTAAGALSWMLSPFLSDKRIKVELSNTKPLLRDPGFKHGDHEGTHGLWTAIDQDGNAKVTLGLHQILSVPLKYVKTMRPTIVGQSVVAIGGPFIGGEYLTTRIGKERCEIKPRQKGVSKVRMEINTNLLAVIA